MRPSPAREAALLAALRLVRLGRAISLESAAQEAGISKPGLMHHFTTKEALMLALVDHVAERWQRQLAGRLSMPAQGASIEDRLTAYIDWALSGDADQDDLIMMMDPRLRAGLIARWLQHVDPWLHVPREPSAERRSALQAARLMADGAWFADATGVLPLASDERAHIRNIAVKLLTDEVQK